MRSFIGSEKGLELILGLKDLFLSRRAAQYYQQRIALSSIIALSRNIKTHYENSLFGHFILHYLSAPLSGINSVVQRKLGYAVCLQCWSSSGKPIKLNFAAVEEIPVLHNQLGSLNHTAPICADSSYNLQTFSSHQTVQRQVFQRLAHRRLDSELPRSLAELAPHDGGADHLYSPLRRAMVCFTNPRDTDEAKVVLQRTDRGENDQASHDLTRSQNHGLAERECNTTPFTYIALGSNMGDRIGHIEAACKKLNMAGIRVLRTSALYETKPMYVEDQNQFINGVCEVSHGSYRYTSLSVMLI